MLLKFPIILSSNSFIFYPTILDKNSLLSELQQKLAQLPKPLQIVYILPHEVVLRHDCDVYATALYTPPIDYLCPTQKNMLHNAKASRRLVSMILHRKQAFYPYDSLGAVAVTSVKP